MCSIQFGRICKVLETSLLHYIVSLCNIAGEVLLFFRDCDISNLFFYTTEWINKFYHYYYVFRNISLNKVIFPLSGFAGCYCYVSLTVIFLLRSRFYVWKIVQMGRAGSGRN